MVFSPFVLRNSRPLGYKLRVVGREVLHTRSLWLAANIGAVHVLAHTQSVTPAKVSAIPAQLLQGSAPSFSNTLPATVVTTKVSELVTGTTRETSDRDTVQ